MTMLKSEGVEGNNVYSRISSFGFGTSQKSARQGILVYSRVVTMPNSLRSHVTAIDTFKNNERSREIFIPLGLF